MFSRIGTKALVLFGISVVALTVSLAFIFYFLGARALEQQVESNLKTTAAVLASQWDGSLLMLLKPGMEESALYRSFSEKMMLMKERTQLSGIYIASPERTHIVSSDPSLRIGQAMPRLDLLGAQIQQAMSGSLSASELVQVDEHKYKSAVAPVYSGDRVAAVLMVDMSPWYLVYLDSFRNSLLLFALVALGCCAIIAHYFSRSITGPISQMVKRVDEIGKAEYEKPLEVKGKDEVAKLAESIELMRRNILSRDAQMKMMLSGIAHEIRNPLGGMELFAGILEKEELPAEQLEYVRKIKTEIRHLKQILNEFLDFARPRLLECEPIAIADLVTEIRTLVSTDLEEKKAAWNIEVHPDAEWIEADRIRLKQALLNLYRNAFQAVPEAGEIRSTIRKNGSGVILDIKNSQVRKLDEEIQLKIFEPFYTTREKGIGLGLPLAKRIIEAHGGEIRISENENTHITFSVKLPISAPAFRRLS